MANDTQMVENPFSIGKFLEQADTVSIVVLIVLGTLSLASWFIIVNKFLDQARINKAYKEMAKKFWTAGSMQEGMGALSGRDNVFRMLAEDGLRAAHYYKGHLADQVSLNDWITVSLYRAIESVGSRLSKGLSVLATTGSVSPFVGLLGTVWGIYNAMIRIALTGETDINNISGPIGEALIMTAIGLFVAVPAVMGYNWLLRRNKDIQEKMRFFIGDIHAYLVGGTRFDTTTPILRSNTSRSVTAPASG